jgi:hypothetical protein
MGNGRRTNTVPPICTPVHHAENAKFKLKCVEHLLGTTIAAVSEL